MSTQQIHDILENDSTRILDASYPAQNQPRKEMFDECHIKNAQFCDIDKFSKFMSHCGSYFLPDEDQFRHQMKELDVRKGDKVVVYDQDTMLGAPRMWWLLRCFGLDAVVMDGNQVKWEAEGRPVWAEPAPKRETPWSDEMFDFKPNLKMAAYFEDVVRQDTAILDARITDVYNKGSMPGSKNVPFNHMINHDKTFKSEEEIRKILEKEGGLTDATKEPVIVSCARGITSCMLYLSLEHIGNPNVRNYMGSYAEYSAKTHK